jgi:tetratricopeptide (TPR) repeat protein
MSGRLDSIKPLLAESVAQIAVRVGLIGVFFYFLLQPPPESPIALPSDTKPRVEPTLNLDLQLVRLYLRTDGTWTDGDRLTLADLFQARGELDKVARFHQGGDPNTLLTTAENQIAAQDWQALQHTLIGLLADNPDQPIANAWMGYSLIPSEEAIPYLQRAAALGDAQAASILGIILVEGYTPRDVALRLLEAEEWAFAERLFGLQLQEDNLDALSYAYRGLARDQLGRNGYDDIQTAIALEPASGIAYYALGMHYRLRDVFDKSLQAFEDAYLLEPRNPAFAAEVAIAYQLTDQLSEAEDWFTVAVSLAPDDERFASLLAAFYADTDYLGDQNIVSLVQAMTVLFPDNASLQTSWGRILFRVGDSQSAEAAFQKALSLTPNDPRTHLYYAEYLESGGNPEDALEHYFLVVSTENPYAEIARIAIRRLTQ